MSSLRHRKAENPRRNTVPMNRQVEVEKRRRRRKESRHLWAAEHGCPLS